MDAREAVGASRSYLAKLYREEEIDDVGLEEIEFDEASSMWSVTIGFSPPGTAGLPPFANMPPPVIQAATRSYKVLRIDDSSGRVDSIEDRILTSTS